MFFKLLTKDNIEIKGEFYLLNSIYTKNDGIYVNPPFELISSLNKRSIFYKIDLSTFIRFKEKYSFIFYPEIIRHYDLKSFTISLNELKELFGVENDYYERFYDFEKNIIKPIINDINHSSQITISYEKIKHGFGKTNKITSLKFSFVDNKKFEIENHTNLIIHNIKNNIKNITGINELIKKSLYNMESKDVLSLINNINTAFEAPIDMFLEVALKSNYRVENNNIKILDVEERFKSCFKLEAQLYKQLSNLKFHYNYQFLNELQNLRTKGIFNYDLFPWKIRATFSSGSLSTIKIYMKLKNDSLNNR